MTAETAGVRSQQDTHCKDCGATVTPSDRFCPACGTPNANTKFHPKFGPALKIVEPRILSDFAPDGSPACPRCGRLIEGDQGFCDGCGMELDVAWDRLHRNEALATLRGDGELRPYRSLNRHGKALPALLMLTLLLALVVGAGNCWLWARSGGRMQLGPSTSDVYRVLGTLTSALFVALGVSYVALVAWMVRAYRNLPALAVGGLRYSARRVVPGWLVPGLDLIRPKQLMDELWRASHPTAAPMSSSWRASPTSIWSTVWWAGLLVGLLFGVTTKLIEPAGTVSTATGQGSVLALAAASALLLVASTLCLRLLVSRIAERQDLRAALVLERGAELDADEAAAVAAGADARSSSSSEVAAPDADGPTAPVLLVRPASRDAVYGKY